MVTCRILNEDLILDGYVELELDENGISEETVRALVKWIKPQTDKEPMAEGDKRLDILERVILETRAEDFDDNTPLPSLRSWILDEWNKVPEAPVIADNARLLNGDEDGYPLLSSGTLGSVFERFVDRNAFNVWAGSLLVNAAVINPETGREVSNIFQLDSSMLALQDNLARKLSAWLGKDYGKMYDNRRYNKEGFEQMMGDARLRFASCVNDGKFRFADPKERTAFFQYFLLHNFDEAVDIYAKGFVKTDPVMKGVREMVANGTKYSSDNLKVKQEWDDDFKTTAMSINTNRLVNQYISSLPELNVDLKPTGNTILMRDFNNFAKLIKENGFRHKDLMREYPGEAVRLVFKEMAEDRRRYFSGVNKLLENTFMTLYYYVFDDNGFSLYSKNKQNLGATKNNLYSMIVNHIIKTASMDYARTSWNADNEEYETSILSSIDMVKSKYDIGTNLSLLASRADMSDIFKDYGVSFTTNVGKNVEAKDAKITGVRFRIGGDEYAVDFKKPDAYGTATVSKFSSDVYVRFFNRVFGQQEGNAYYEGLVNANQGNLGDAGCLINLAATMFLANRLSKGDPLDPASVSKRISDGGIRAALIDGLFDTKSTRTWFNRNIGCLRVEGIANALKGVEVLARAKAYATKNITASNVKNAEGSMLPKFGLTCLGEGDEARFGKLQRMANGARMGSTMFHYNIYGRIRAYTRNVFKTEFVSQDGTSKQVKDMTAAELLYDAIVSNYFANKSADGGSVIIQPAVYADKGRVQAKEVAMARFSYQSYDGAMVVEEKGFDEMTYEELDNLFYHSMRSQLKILKDTLKKDYDDLFGALKELHPRMFGGSLPSSWEGYEEWVARLDDGLLYQATRHLQEHGKNPVIIPEIHFSKNKGKYGFNNLLKYDFMRFTGDSMDEFRRKCRLEEALYAETLRMNEVRIPLLFADGKPNKAVTEHITKDEDQRGYISHVLDGIDGKAGDAIMSRLGGMGKKAFTYEDLWMDHRTEELVPYLAFDKEGNPIDDRSMPLDDAIVILNPDLYRYQRLDNIISDNYNLATTGLEYLHPAKTRAESLDARGIKAEEAARTVNFTKRGVIYGGTGHTLLKNKKDGIPQYLNIAAIEDLSGIVGTLTGDSKGHDMHDGALHFSPFFAVWFRNSSPDLNHSSVHEKPLWFSGHDAYGASMLGKCATFNITNSSMRSSTTSRVSMEDMMREMCDRPWLIPNIDLTGKVSCAFYLDPSLDMNRHFKIIGLERKAVAVNGGRVDNRYEVEYYETDDRGKQTSDGTYKKEVSINSNYDLWKVLGGAWSCSLVNGRLLPSEASVEEVARIASNVNLDGDSKDIKEYNEIIAARTGRGKAVFPKDGGITALSGARQDGVIPPRYLKTDGKAYFQPMKYSDVHCLGNISGLKNGPANVNPSSIYTTPVKHKMRQGSRLVFAHGKLGATTSAKMGHGLVEYKYAEGDDALAGITALQERGNTVVISDPRLLSLPGIAVDEIYLMSAEDYIGRNGSAGSPDAALHAGENTAVMEAARAYAEAHPETAVVDATGHYLEDYIGSRLLVSEADPSYMVIQLTAEHDVENDKVSEMTQVISLLEQGSYTHDLAVDILTDIGRTIANKLRLYDKDLSKDVNRQTVNAILGRALCRVFEDNGDSFSLASAYLEEIRKELEENRIVTDLIPFDDNNLLGMFETNFRNGFNKDIIRRKFPGFSGIMTPTEDIFAIYDDGDTPIGIQDIAKIAAKKGTKTLEDTLASLDAMVPASSIQCGDWVEMDGKAFLVGTLSSPHPGVPSVSLSAVKAMRGQTVKKLGSKGRNLRAQNYFVTVEEGSVNTPDTHFDLYDLDTVNLAGNLTAFLDGALGERQQYFEAVFAETASAVKAAFPNVDLQALRAPQHKETLARYIRWAIQEDMDALQSGSYHVPVAYRTTDGNGMPVAYANVASSRYQANELAVGKPFASKFLLEPGDTIADVNTEFFRKKLAARSANPFGKGDLDLFMTGNGYTLCFSNDKDAVTALKAKGYEVERIDITDSTIYNAEGAMRKVRDGIAYSISNDMAFYRVKTPGGRSVELVTGYGTDDIEAIWGSDSFHTNVFDFTRMQAAGTKMSAMGLHDADKAPQEFKDLLESYCRINYKGEPLDWSFVAMNNYVQDIKPEKEMLSRAIKMDRSFKEALKVIAARIPAQSMQSFMNMKIAVFADTDTNIALSPLAMIVFEGSDFDIDKIYVMGFSIGDNGVFTNWSPYFIWGDELSFELSKQLPLPNGKDYYADDIDGLDVSEYNDLEHLYKGRQYAAFLIRFKELLDKTQDATGLAGASDYLMRMVRRHNKYKFDADKALKNKIFNNMYRIGQDPRNYLAETVELNIDIAKKAAGRSDAGRFGALVSNENPGAKMVAQEENSVGKSSVGIYANGNKAFSSLLVFYQDRLSKEIPAAMEEARAMTGTDDPVAVAMAAEAEWDALKQELMTRHGIDEEGFNKFKEARLDDFDASNMEELDGAELDGSVKERIRRACRLSELSSMMSPDRYRLFNKDESRFAFKDDAGDEHVMAFAPTLPNVKLQGNAVTDTFINEMMLSGLQEEVFDSIGVMINVSTDNAKELVLRKLNASGRMGNVFIYLLCCGVPFDTAARFMTTGIVSLVSRKVQSDMFKEETRFASVQRAVQHYHDGVSIDDFVGREYADNARELLQRICREHGMDGSDAIPADAKAFTEHFRSMEPATALKIMGWVASSDATSIAKDVKTPSYSEDDDFFEDDDDEVFRRASDVKEVKHLVNRFLKAVIDRHDALARLGEDSMNTLELLSRFSEGGNEITEYAQWCAINQGLPTMKEDFYNFVKRRERYLNKRLSQINETFDFMRFIKEPAYRKAKISQYGRVKTTFNILESIAASPHFSMMYKALAANEDILNTFSYKHRKFAELADEVTGRKIVHDLDPKTSRVIKRYIDDAVTVQFFADTGFTIGLQGQELPYYNADGSTTVREQERLDLSTVFGRASFKRIMEDHIIPRLKKEYPGNRFLQDLTFGYDETQFGVRDYMKMPIDLNNLPTEMNMQLFTDYVTGFNELKDKAFMDDPSVTYGDLFFAYNLLCNNNGIGPKTLTRLFEDAARTRTPGSLMSRFLEYEKELPGKELPLDTRDLLMRFAGQPGSGFTLSMDGNGKHIYDDNGNRLDLFAEHNPSGLFYQEGVVKMYQERVDKMFARFMELFKENKIAIKLTCDE